MPTATWPSSPTLPSAPGYGWTKVPGVNSIRTQTDAGPAKVRKRFTAVPSVYQMAFMMTGAQHVRLVQFYENASDGSPAGTSGGSIQFDGLPDPVDDGAATWRFLEPPTVTHAGPDAFRVALKLEKMI